MIRALRWNEPMVGLMKFLLIVLMLVASLFVVNMDWRTSGRVVGDIEQIDWPKGLGWSWASSSNLDWEQVTLPDGWMPDLSGCNNHLKEELCWDVREAYTKDGEHVVDVRLMNGDEVIGESQNIALRTEEFSAEMPVLAELGSDEFYVIALRTAPAWRLNGFGKLVYIASLKALQYLNSEWGVSRVYQLVNITTMSKARWLQSLLEAIPIENRVWVSSDAFIFYLEVGS